MIPSDLEIALNYKYDILAGVSSINKYIIGYRIFFTGIIQNYIESPVTRAFLEKCPCKRQRLKRIFNPSYPIKTNPSTSFHSTLDLPSPAISLLSPHHNPLLHQPSFLPGSSLYVSHDSPQ